MDSGHVSRLKEELERSLDETLSTAKKWEKFNEDYTVLQDRLRSLPDKVSHNIMVPFGPVAFMPGQIVHTNEVMVLLGDNWFCERSAKQACEIIDRRKEHVESMLSDLAKQTHLLKSRLGFTSELKDMSENKGELVDIREDYDPEKEAKWREDRKKKIKRVPSCSEQGKTLEGNHASHQKTSNEVKGQRSNQPGNSGMLQNQPQTVTNAGLITSSGTDETGIGYRGDVRRDNADDEAGMMTGEAEGDGREAGRRMTEEEIWARLDKLERQEEELDELALQVMSEEETEHDEDKNSGQTEDVVGKHVQWQDKQGDTDSDDEEESEEGDPIKPTTITFKHSQQAEINYKTSNDSTSSSTPTGIPTAIQSPADIYSQYLSVSAQSPGGGTLNQPLKSILNSGPRSHLVRAPEGLDRMQRKEVKSHVILPAPPSAFSGQVSERVETPATAEVVTSPPSNTETTAPPKRLSRFKAARQHQQQR